MLLWDHRDQGYTFEQCDNCTYWLSLILTHLLRCEKTEQSVDLTLFLHEINMDKYVSYSVCIA